MFNTHTPKCPNVQHSRSKISICFHSHFPPLRHRRVGLEVHWPHTTSWTLVAARRGGGRALPGRGCRTPLPPRTGPLPTRGRRRGSWGGAGTEVKNCSCAEVHTYIYMYAHTHRCTCLSPHHTTPPHLTCLPTAPRVR